MLDTEQINDLHRLYWSERWSNRKIERHLKMGWRTIRKYLEAPAQGPVLRSRSSKLDSFKGNIAEWLEKDPQVTAAGHRIGPAATRLGRRIEHRPGICPPCPAATGSAPCFRAHGAGGRGTVRRSVSRSAGWNFSGQRPEPTPPWQLRAMTKASSHPTRVSIGVVLPFVTESWAKMVFPELPTAEASDKLWRAVFDATRCGTTA